MKHRNRWISILLILVPLAGTRGAEGDGKAMESARGFHLEDLAGQREAFKNGYYQFLKVPTLRCGLYELAKGAQDKQSPHQEDEVYHILKGRAVLRIQKDGKVEDMPARAGSILFVAAQVEHRFVEIEEDLQVLVFFASAPQTPAGEGSR